MPDAPFASGAAGTTAAAFLKLPSGARPQALAGAVAASALGAEALFWNPAALAAMDPSGPSEVTVGYNALLEGTYSGAGAYAQPTKNGAFAAGFTHFGQSAQTRYNGRGDDVGSFAPNDQAFVFGYGHRFEPVSVGGALELIRSSVGDASGVTAAVDLGIQARHVAVAGDGPIDVGASILHLGPPLRVGAAAPLPLSIRAGALWHVTSFLAPAFDVVMPVDQDPYIAFGVEGRIPVGGGKRGEDRAAFIRAGYNQNQGRDVDGTLVGMTAGAGLDLGKFRFDYAWVPFGDLGTTNRISLAFRL